MRCNRLLQRSTFGTTEKELIKGSNLRHFNGSFRAERVLIRHRLKWTRHFAHATGTVSVRVRRTEVFESPFWESLSGEQKFAITVFKPWEGRRYPQALNSFVWFLLKIRLGRAVRKRFAFSRTVVRSCFADLKISALLFDFCAENQYGWTSIAAAQVRILAPHKAQASGGISVWLIFCAVSAKQKLLQNIEISVIRKNFSSAQRNLFFDSVCGLSGQFVDSAVLILKSEVCRTAFSQNRSWLKSFFAGSIFVRRKNRKFRRYFCYEENNCTVCSGFDAALCSSFRRNRRDEPCRGENSGRFSRCRFRSARWCCIRWIQP